MCDDTTNKAQQRHHPGEWNVCEYAEHEHPAPGPRSAVERHNHAVCAPPAAARPGRAAATCHFGELPPAPPSPPGQNGTQRRGASPPCPPPHPRPRVPPWHAKDGMLGLHAPPRWRGLRMRMADRIIVKGLRSVLTGPPRPGSEVPLFLTHSHSLANIFSGTIIYFGFI
jgi:hypothetical protein